MTVQVQPVFGKNGVVSYIVAHSGLGVAVVVDALPGKWSTYEARAARLGCTLRRVLFTAADRVHADVGVPWIGPAGAHAEGVTVLDGGAVRILSPGVGDLVLMIRGLILGCVATSAKQGGRLAFVFPQQPAVFGHGALHHADAHRIADESHLVPDWLLGLAPGGRVFASVAPEGIYVRDIDEEVQVRDVSRSRIRRQLASVGRTSAPELISALGLEATLQ